MRVKFLFKIVGIKWLIIIVYLIFVVLLHFIFGANTSQMMFHLTKGADVNIYVASASVAALNFNLILTGRCTLKSFPVH